MTKALKHVIISIIYNKAFGEIMNLELKGLKKDEIVSLKLRKLFESYGYAQYKMSKFEEYSFYMDNKNFLKSEQIIAFSDKSGRLMALKPDITLSIAKNSRASEGTSEKLYYNESVYRYAKHSKEYKEFQQMGLEFMGKIDDYQTLEIITLALKSLEAISEDFVLDLSHMGLIAGLFELINITSDTEKENLLSCIVGKNSHDLEKTAASYNISETNIALLKDVLACPNTLNEAIYFWKGVAKNDTLKCAVDDIVRLCNSFNGSSYLQKLRLDISIVNDTNYYNNLIFQGYIKNLPFMVLSGGRYDPLLHKFGRNINAMGFALSIDELSRYFPLNKDKNEASAVVYDTSTDINVLCDIIEGQRAKGYKVTAITGNPNLENFGKVIYLTNGLAEEQYV